MNSGISLLALGVFALAIASLANGKNDSNQRARIDGLTGRIEILDLRIKELEKVDARR